MRVYILICESDEQCVSLQLFARLEARHCLKDIEPRLFPENGRPDHGTPGPRPVTICHMMMDLLCHTAYGRQQHNETLKLDDAICVKMVLRVMT